MSRPKLDLASLQQAATLFGQSESRHAEPTLYGVTDGKAVGTYLEHKFRDYLERGYLFVAGNSASGVDFPQLNVDMKVTSTRQPQSSCPFKSARDKIYGLGYSLLVFVYDKRDDDRRKSSTLEIVHTVFVDSASTADFQTSAGLIAILDRRGNKDDILAFFEERNLPLDEVGADLLADEVLLRRPAQGYLTISNALQWRLQYSRVIDVAGSVSGVTRL